MYLSGFILLFHTILLTAPVDCDLHVISSGVPGNNTYDLIARYQNDVVLQQPDFAVMMVGTNDMVNSSKLTSYEEFSSNIDRLVESFRKNGIELILVSPPPVDSIYLFRRHSPKRFDDPPNIRLKKARDILSSKAKYHSITFIDVFDLFKKKNIPDHNKDYVIRNYSNSGVYDGVHPTSVGYQMIADEIFRVLILEQESITSNSRIICFGDSITWGVGVVGEGTVSGKTYPAFLKKRLCSYLK